MAAFNHLEKCARAVQIYLTVVRRSDKKEIKTNDINDSTVTYFICTCSTNEFSSISTEYITKQ